MNKALSNKKNILIIGLIMFLVGGLVYILFPEDSSTPMLPFEYWEQKLSVAFLLLILSAAFVEEIIFRGWTKWGNYSSLFVVLQVLVCFVSGIRVGVVACLLGAIVLLLLKKKFHRTATLLIGSSLLFALAHWAKVEQFSWEKIFFFIGILGAGITFGTIALMSKLRYSMIAHASYNFAIFTFCSFYIFSIGNQQTITNDRFKIEMEQKFQPISFEYKDADSSIHYAATIEGMVEHLMNEYHIDKGFDPNNLHIFYRYDKNSSLSKYYSVDITSSSAIIKHSEYRDIVKMLETNQVVKLDTLYEGINYLEIVDPQKAGGMLECHYTLEELVSDLRILFGVPVFAGDGVNVQYPLMDSLKNKINSANTFDECKDVLSEYGIATEEHQESKAQVVMITNLL